MNRETIYSRGFSVSQPEPGCSKLTTSLVNVLLKFQTLIGVVGWCDGAG